MPITHAQAIEAQAAIQRILLEDDNVVSIGVIEEVNAEGVKTGNHLLRVGVISLEVERDKQARSQSLFPRNLQGVQIQFFNEGPVMAQYANPKPFPLETESYPFAESGSEVIPLSFPGHARPAPGGSSIGHFRITAGTLGGLIHFTTGPKQGRRYILSNNHVLADSNKANNGAPHHHSSDTPTRSLHTMSAAGKVRFFPAPVSGRQVHSPVGRTLLAQAARAVLPTVLKAVRGFR